MFKKWLVFSAFQMLILGGMISAAYVSSIQPFP